MSTNQPISVWLKVKGYAAYKRDMLNAAAMTERVGKSARKTGGAFQFATNKMGAFSRGLGIVHRMSYLVSVGLTAAIGSAAMSFVDFNQQMANLKAVTGASEPELKVLHDQILQLGASTKFSNDEIAQTATTLAKAGYSVTQVGQLLPGVSTFAAAASIELADAVSLVSDQVTVFGLSAEDASGVSDILTVALNASKLEAADLAESMKYVGPIAHQAGLTLEETSAAIAALAQQGMKGSQSGTSLRMGLMRLARSPKAVTEAFEELGVSQEAFMTPEGNFKPIGDMIDMLKNLTRNMGGMEKTRIFSKIFGAEAAPAWVALTATIGDAGKSYGELLGMIEQADKENVAAHQAETMMDTISGAFEKLRGQWETLWIDTLEPFEEDIKDLFGWIEYWIDMLGRDTDFVMKQIVGPGWDDFKERVQDLVEELIDNFWPILVDLGEKAWWIAKTVLPLMDKGIEFMEDHATTTRVALGLLVGVFVAWKALQMARYIRGIVFAMVILNSVMRKNPWIALAFAITAIVTALITLYETDPRFHAWVDDKANALWDFRDTVTEWWDNIKGIFTQEGPWWDAIVDQFRYMVNITLKVLNDATEQINKLLPEQMHLSYSEYIDTGIDSMEERFKDPFFGTGGVIAEDIAERMKGGGVLEGLGPGLTMKEKDALGMLPGRHPPWAVPPVQDAPRYNYPDLDLGSDQDKVFPSRNGQGFGFGKIFDITTHVYLDKKKIAKAVADSRADAEARN